MKVTVQIKKMKRRNENLNKLLYLESNGIFSIFFVKMQRKNFNCAKYRLACKHTIPYLICFIKFYFYL